LVIHNYICAAKKYADRFIAEAENEADDMGSVPS